MTYHGDIDAGICNQLAQNGCELIYYAYPEGDDKYVLHFPLECLKGKRPLGRHKTRIKIILK